MRVIVFDTETTGLPISWEASADDVNNWPRIVEIAWLVLDGHAKKLYVRQVVRPEGFSVPKEIAAIHGISNEEALRVGSSLNYVMACFVKAIASADMVVAHNIGFDYPVVNCELIRLGIEYPLSEANHFCTMRSTVELCQISGGSGYKWPKLQELYRYLFGVNFSDAHSALADANATADCFIELNKRGLA